MTHQELADKYGISQEAVHKMAVRYKVVKTKDALSRIMKECAPKGPQMNTRNILAFYPQFTRRQIARRLGIKLVIVTDAIKRWGSEEQKSHLSSEIRKAPTPL